MSRDRDQLADYGVGYGKPPLATRFKPSVSGNPSGRPKAAKNLTTVVHEALNEPVIVAENGRRRTVSKPQAIIKLLISRSAQGDLKATQILLGVMQDIERHSAAEPAETAFDAADQLVIDQLRARLQDRVG